MEENENPWKLSAVSASFLIEIMTVPPNSDSHLPNNPLFSCIVTLYALIFLYFPHALGLSLAPVLILTAILLLFLLRLGAVQRLNISNPENNGQEEHIETEVTSGCDSEKSGLLVELDKWVAHHAQTGSNPRRHRDFEETFIEWDVKAPLEVIYEAYEGEEDEENPNEKHQDSDPKRFPGLNRYPSLSMYYPETDSDCSSDSDFQVAGLWDSPESVCFEWEEEDREDLLIEIALDSKEKKASALGLYVEDDNLIEIDLSP